MGDVMKITRKELSESLLNDIDKIENHETDFMPHDSGLNQYASGIDSDGIYTVIEFKRVDDTLYLKSTLSNPNDNGSYQTCIWEFYDEDGTTLSLTKTWTIAYDNNGIATSKVVS